MIGVEINSQDQQYLVSKHIIINAATISPPAFSFHCLSIFCFIYNQTCSLLSSNFVVKIRDHKNNGRPN